MNRKWRTNRGALDTVQAYPAFREAIPPRDAPYSLSDPTDLYAVYTVLHIESKQAELRWSSHGRFYYFLVQWEQPMEQAGVIAAPEGDEDPPPQVGKRERRQQAGAACNPACCDAWVQQPACYPKEFVQLCADHSGGLRGSASAGGSRPTAAAGAAAARDPQARQAGAQGSKTATTAAATTTA